MPASAATPHNSLDLAQVLLSGRTLRYNDPRQSDIDRAHQPAQLLDRIGCDTAAARARLLANFDAERFKKGAQGRIGDVERIHQ